MSKNIKNSVIIDFIGVELMLGEPIACLRKGEQGSACCCDECDYHLLCFPEFEREIKSENIFMNIENDLDTL